MVLVVPGVEILLMIGRRVEPDRQHEFGVFHGPVAVRENLPEDSPLRVAKL